MRLGSANLDEVLRCPHCGIANPQLNNLWESNGCVRRTSDGPTSSWSTYACTTCGGVVLAKSEDNPSVENAKVATLYPQIKTADEELPDMARNFLQQAYETLHAPDAAAVMAGSAVDAMLKACDYEDGSLYTRIDKAVADNLLTEKMGDWAHSVRLGSNRPRHADKDKPHVSTNEAQQSVEFAEALGQFLFALTAKIERGIQAAQEET